MNNYDLIIVGGGISGMLCAIDSKKNGINNILLIEKDAVLGGSLNLLTYKMENSKFSNSKEYKEALIKEVHELDIELKLGTLVININENKNVICTSASNGFEELSAKTIILANGSKEKGLNNLEISGDRCSGVFSLKTAKKIFNMENTVPGKNILIYGTENLSYIKDELASTKSNIVALVGNTINENHTAIANPKETFEGYKVTELLGSGRLSKVIISNDHDEKEIVCDCLIFAHGLLSDGLVAFRSGIALNPKTTGPKVNEVYETSTKNVFACGDGIYIHTSLDEIKEEAEALALEISKRLN